MKTVSIQTVAFEGVRPVAIEVQATLVPGNVMFNVVGMGNKAVGESRERVRAALSAMHIALPDKRLSVNLAPADIVKEGSHFDFAIAVSVMVLLGAIPYDGVRDKVFIGEVSLDGRLRPVNGVLPAALYAFENNYDLVCPEDSGPEAAWIDGLTVVAPPSLLALVNHVKGFQVLPTPQPNMVLHKTETRDLSEVKGQEVARRALEIAAAGNHNMLMVGPPGAGKSMLAACLPSILPPLLPKEALETSMIHSISGYLHEGRLLAHRPFRAPHHSASLPALVGGGPKAKPGEISLAHNGVLFLDELPEFASATLEALRQPLETRTIHVARANAHITYPAHIQLIAAMNPCKCGYMANATLACSQAPKCGERYQNRLSGPLMDRFDLQVSVDEITIDHLTSRGAPAESSAAVARRVLRAKERQKIRYGDTRIKTNDQLSGELLESVCKIDDKSHDLLKRAAIAFHLSGRGYHRVLRVARTIADLAGSDDLTYEHVAEALSYRRMGVAAKGMS
jgi:magnesium chelatase family protein